MELKREPVVSSPSHTSPPNMSISPEGNEVIEKLDRGDGCMHGMTFTAVRSKSFLAKPYSARENKGRISKMSIQQKIGTKQSGILKDVNQQ